jgi:hypothetical protein
MALVIRRVDYFYTTVRDEPGEAYKLLSRLAEADVNLLAFNAVPIGPGHTQLVLFPDMSAQLVKLAEGLGLPLQGPFRALLIQGDDRLGALADVHERLFDAKINVYSSNGITDGSGAFGCILYLRPEDLERGAKALGV